MRKLTMQELNLLYLVAGLPYRFDLVPEAHSLPYLFDEKRVERISLGI